MSLYCNHATYEAFKVLFQEFFDAVWRVTEKALGLVAFNKEASLYNFIFNTEAAQIQGFGDFLLTQNNLTISGITTKDLLVLVQHVAKTCLQYFNW